VSKTELKKEQNNLLASINDPSLAKRVARFAGEARREIASEKLKNSRLEQQNQHLSELLSQHESDASIRAREHDETRQIIFHAFRLIARNIESTSQAINFIQEYIVTSSHLHGFQMAMIQKALEFDGFCGDDFICMMENLVESANCSLEASGWKRSRFVFTDNHGITISFSPVDDPGK